MQADSASPSTFASKRIRCQRRGACGAGITRKPPGDLELRRMALPWLDLAAGGGVRFIFPPEVFNQVRIDVAVSDSGWTIVTG